MTNPKTQPRTAAGRAYVHRNRAEGEIASWCVTHDDLAWLFTDGSVTCLNRLIVESASDDCTTIPLAIEAEVAEQSVPLDVLASVLHDALPCRWKAHAGFTAQTDREYHEQQASHILRGLARLVDGAQATPQPAVSDAMLATGAHVKPDPGPRRESAPARADRKPKQRPAAHPAGSADTALDTVERIRNAVGPPRYPMETESWHYIIAILDKEAAALRILDEAEWSQP